MQGILYLTNEPKLKEDSPTKMAKIIVKRKKVNNKGSLKIKYTNFKGPTLKIVKMVNKNKKADSIAEKKIIILPLSHK